MVCLDYNDRCTVEADLQALTTAGANLPFCGTNGAQTNIPSPICRLPPEILAEIFLQCLRDNPHPRIRIARVCRLWGSIVFSTPVLWSIIGITIDNSTPAAVLALMRRLFERSSACPLKLRILIRPSYFGDVDSRDEVSNRQQTLDLVTSTAHRWQTIELQLSPSGPNERLLDGKQLHLPLLESLAIHVLSSTHHMGTNFISNMFTDSPSLRTLHVDGVPISMSRTLGLRWTLLTTLRVTKLSFEDMSEIVRRCTSLIYCRYDRLEPRLCMGIDQISLAKLKLLDLELNPSIDEPWETFDLPALDSLTVCVRGYLHPEWVDRFISFLRHSHTSLRCLRLRHVALSNTNAITILQFMSDLVEFEYIPRHPSSMSRERHHTPLFDRLRAVPRDQDGQRLSPLVPNLQRLTLGGSRGYTITDYERCIGMVRSRWQGVVDHDDGSFLTSSQVMKLRYARLCFGKGWGGEWVSREVTDLQDEGMDIWLSDTVS